MNKNSLKKVNVKIQPFSFDPTCICCGTTENLPKNITLGA